MSRVPDIREDVRAALAEVANPSVSNARFEEGVNTILANAPALLAALDEARHTIAVYESHGPDGHNVTNLQYQETRRERDEAVGCRAANEQRLSNALRERDEAREEIARLTAPDGPVGPFLDRIRQLEADMDACDACSGRGTHLVDGEPEPCPDCDGSGWSVVRRLRADVERLKASVIAHQLNESASADSLSEKLKEIERLRADKSQLNDVVASYVGSTQKLKADLAAREEAAFRTGYRAAERDYAEPVEINAEHDAVARWIRRRLGKCDGNHALSVPCADPECWQKGGSDG